MSKLEDLKPNAIVAGILPGNAVSIVAVKWFGTDVIEITHKSPTGKIAAEILFRANESQLEILEQGRPF